VGLGGLEKATRFGEGTERARSLEAFFHNLGEPAVFVPRWSDVSEELTPGEAVVAEMRKGREPNRSMTHGGRRC